MQCNIIIKNSASENSTSIYLFIIINLFIIIITYYKYFNNPATSATIAFFNCIDHFNFYSTIYIGILGLLREMGSLGSKFYLCLLNGMADVLKFNLLHPPPLKQKLPISFLHFQNPKLGYLPETRVFTRNSSIYPIRHKLPDDLRVSWSSAELPKSATLPESQQPVIVMEEASGGFSWSTKSSQHRVIPNLFP